MTAPWRETVAEVIRDEYDRADPLSEGFRPAACCLADALTDTIARLLTEARAEERERIAQAIEAAFPLPSDAEPEPCSAGHDCHAAARYTTGRMAARIARTATQAPATSTEEER